MAKAKLGSGPAFDGVASLAGCHELPAMRFLMAIGAGAMLQPEIINPRGIRVAQLLMAFVAGNLSVFSLALEIGQFVIKRVLVQRHKHGGVGGMFLVASDAVAFEGAVVSDQVCPALLDVGMTLLTFGVEDFSGEGMAFRA